MELKLELDVELLNGHERSNRTFMELKFVIECQRI